MDSPLSGESTCMWTVQYLEYLPVCGQSSIWSIYLSVASPVSGVSTSLWTVQYLEYLPLCGPSSIWSIYLSVDSPVTGVSTSLWTVQYVKYLSLLFSSSALSRGGVFGQSSVQNLTLPPSRVCWPGKGKFIVCLAGPFC